MDGFIGLEKRIKSFDIDKILQSVWSNPAVKKFIIELITEDQLYDKGIDGNNDSLGEYTTYSVELKLRGSGDKRVDHITLKDSGSFYDSVEVVPNSKGFDTEANPIVDDGKNLYDRFGKDIIKLTNESTKVLTEFITPFFNSEAEKSLQ